MCWFDQQYYHSAQTRSIQFVNTSGWVIESTTSKNTKNYDTKGKTVVLWQKTMLIYRKLWKFDKRGGGMVDNQKLWNFDSKWKKIYGYLTISFLNTKNVNNGEFLNKYSVLKFWFVKNYGTMNKPMIVYLKLLTFVFLWKQLCY